MRLMQTIKVTVVNMTDITEYAVRDGVEALQHQVDADFGPIWNVSAHLHVLVARAPNAIPEGQWGLVLSDREAGDDEHWTVHGQPMAWVNVASDPERWTFPASQALLDRLANPRRNLAVLNRDPEHDDRRLFALLVCEPVAYPDYGYEVQSSEKSWLVSDFVYPAWFESASSPRGVQLDRTGSSVTPLQPNDGGSMWVFEDGRWVLHVMEDGVDTTPPIPKGTYPPP